MNMPPPPLLRIAVLQTNIVWCAPEINRQHIERLLHDSPHADLYLLPEMFDTGFCMNPQAIAQGAPETLVWMQHIAAAKGCALAGSIAIRERDSYYNRFYFVEPQKVTYYDKHHLFGYGGEKKHYQQGQSRIIAPFRGVRFLLQVCYDLRFPVFARNKGDYDAILYVANWPEPRITVWDTLLRARAIENQCYVAGANRVGKDPSCSYPGNSLIINPYGQAEAEAAIGQECIISAEIDMPRLEAFRKKFPVGDDRDAFSLGLSHEEEQPSL